MGAAAADFAVAIHRHQPQPVSLLVGAGGRADAGQQGNRLFHHPVLRRSGAGVGVPAALGIFDATPELVGHQRRRRFLHPARDPDAATGGGDAGGDSATIGTDAGGERLRVNRRDGRAGLGGTLRNAAGLGVAALVGNPGRGCAGWRDGRIGMVAMAGANPRQRPDSCRCGGGGSGGSQRGGGGGNRAAAGRPCDHIVPGCRPCRSGCSRLCGGGGTGAVGGGDFPTEWNVGAPDNAGIRAGRVADAAVAIPAHSKHDAIRRSLAKLGGGGNRGSGSGTGRRQLSGARAGAVGLVCRERGGGSVLGRRRLADCRWHLLRRLDGALHDAVHQRRRAVHRLMAKPRATGWRSRKRRGGISPGTTTASG